MAIPRTVRVAGDNFPLDLFLLGAKHFHEMADAFRGQTGEPFEFQDPLNGVEENLAYNAFLVGPEDQRDRTLDLLSSRVNA